MIEAICEYTARLLGPATTDKKKDHRYLSVWLLPLGNRRIALFGF